MPRDLSEAVRLFRIGAEEGNASAQSNFAFAYMNGEGVERDYAAAMLWARRAADQGDASGEGNVGVLYKNGWGVLQDLRAAVLCHANCAIVTVSPDAS